MLTVPPKKKFRAIGALLRVAEFDMSCILRRGRGGPWAGYMGDPEVPRCLLEVGMVANMCIQVHTAVSQVGGGRSEKKGGFGSIWGCGGPAGRHSKNRLRTNSHQFAGLCWQPTSSSS